MSSLLRAQNLTKDFGNKKGVFDLNFEIEPGEIVGFVGPNGAGKSTTINMLAGNTHPDVGNIHLFDRAISQQNIYEFMPKLGILLSEPTLELSITPRQLFIESEQLLGLHKTSQWQIMSKVINLDVDKVIEKLSLGNKKKVGIILALMHQPQLVIMDEPTSGIDPLVEAKFSQLLRDVANRGGSVLLSSHDLGEIQDVCNRVIMIKNGKIIIDSPVNELLQKSTRRFIIKNPGKELGKILHDLYGKSLLKTTSGLSIHSQDYKVVIELLTKHKCYDFFIESPSLEEMFAEYYK